MGKYGYVRVSSKDQNPDRQIDAMRERGIASHRIYVDKLSGKNFQRTNYNRLLKRMKKGDCIIFTSIDRLGRNYGEILEQWRYLTKEKQVDIEVIDMPLLNTASEREGLTGVFIADLVLQILAYVAETERSFIKQRQAEGIASAKLRGVRFGAKRQETPDCFADYFKMWRNGTISLRKAAAEIGMSYSTFYRRCIEKEEEE